MFRYTKTVDEIPLSEREKEEQLFDAIAAAYGDAEQAKKVIEQRREFFKNRGSF